MQNFVVMGDGYMRRSRRMELSSRFSKKERSTFETERWALIFEDVRTVPLRVTVPLINRESDSLLSAEKFYAIMKKSTNQVKSKQIRQNRVLRQL